MATTSQEERMGVGSRHLRYSCRQWLTTFLYSHPRCTLVVVVAVAYSLVLVAMTWELKCQIKMPGPLCFGTFWV